MKKYLYFAKIAIQAEFAYSAWYWASLFSSLFMIMVQFYFWKSVLGANGSIGDMDFSQMITYYVLALAIGTFAPFTAGREIGIAVYEGSIAIEFIRPYNILLKAMSIASGEIIVSIFGGFLINIAIGFLFFGVSLPVSAVALFFFVVSLLIGIIITQIIDMCIGVITFWTSNLWGLRTLRFAMFTLFSGQLLPLDLFPQWFQTLSKLLPFRQIVHTPIMIYTGRQSVDATLFFAFLTQIMWVGICFVLLQIMWRSARKQVTVFGG